MVRKGKISRYIQCLAVSFLLAGCTNGASLIQIPGLVVMYTQVSDTTVNHIRSGGIDKSSFLGSLFTITGAPLNLVSGQLDVLLTSNSAFAVTQLTGLPTAWTQIQLTRTNIQSPLSTIGTVSGVAVDLILNPRANPRLSTQWGGIARVAGSLNQIPFIVTPPGPPTSVAPASADLFTTVIPIQISGKTEIFYDQTSGGQTRIFQSTEGLTPLQISPEGDSESRTLQDVSQDGQLVLYLESDECYVRDARTTTVLFTQLTSDGAAPLMACRFSSIDTGELSIIALRTVTDSGKNEVIGFNAFSALDGGSTIDTETYVIIAEEIIADGVNFPGVFNVRMRPTAVAIRHKNDLVNPLVVETEETTEGSEE